MWLELERIAPEHQRDRAIVLADELAAGRIWKSSDGRYALRRSAFDHDVVIALATLDIASWTPPPSNRRKRARRPRPSEAAI